VQRIVLVGILLACVGASVFLVGWARKSEMTLLYAGLSPEEASRIVDKVREGGSQYELKEDGTAIYVPVDKAPSLRLTMASAGLPKGSNEGYRILDEEKIGVNPFMQKINYTRAVEGELAKTVGLLDGVVAARVHIAKSEEAIFNSHEKDTSATVMLRLKPGWRLSGANVAAIIHLVSGSVEGLSPQKVVVVDAQGNLLSGQGDSELASKAGSLIEYKRRVEEYYSHKAEDMLCATLGPGRASVRVDATIDNTQMEQVVEKLTSEGKIVAKEVNKTVSSPGAGGNGSKEDESTTEYLNPPMTKESKTILAGSVKSLTVAAFVDLSAPPASAAAPTPAGGATPAPTPEAAKMTLKQAEDVIRGAIGLKKEDQLTVVDTPFYKAPVADTKADDDKQSNRDFYLEIARRSSLGLLVVGALAAMKILAGSRKKGLPAGGAVPALEGQSARGALPSGEGEDPELLRSRITRALQENPEEVKRLFLSWVESEKEEV